MLAVVRLTGPDFEREVTLDPGGAELTLGRDSKQANVKLPDPELFISRKHVALRSTDAGVELRVVSAVNGAETSKGSVRPGERIHLDDSDYFVLGPYTVTVNLIATDEASPPPLRTPGRHRSSDIYAALFENAPVSGMPASPPPQPAPPGEPEVRSSSKSKIEAWLNNGIEADDDDNVAAHAGTRAYPRPPENDAIGTPEPDETDGHVSGALPGDDSPSAGVWKVFSEKGARNGSGEEHYDQEGAPAPPHQAPAPVQPDLWKAFVGGLGLPSSHLIDERTAEHTGTMIRLLVEGLVELLKARSEIKRQLGVTDRTEIRGHANNAFKLDLSTLERVQYIFSPHVGATYMPAAQAVRESISELQMHEHATLLAARAALEGALKEFEPARLRSQLIHGRSSSMPLLGNARAWKAYEDYYQRRSAHFGDWLEKTFDRYFTPTYAQESTRLKSLQAPHTDVDPT